MNGKEWDQMSPAEKAMEKAKLPHNGVWVVYPQDWLDFALFGQEMAALRFALERGWRVVRAPYGRPVREAVAEAVVEP